MASRAGRQPSPTTDPLPAERRGRASDGAQNRPPRQPPGQGPRRREPGDAVGTAGGRSVPAGCGHRRPGPMHVRPPTPGALFLAREPHAGRADPGRAAPAGCAAVHLYVVRNRRRRRPPPVCISWCPRGDLDTVKWEPSHQRRPRWGRGAVCAASWTWSERSAPLGQDRRAAWPVRVDPLRGHRRGVGASRILPR